MSTHVWHCAVCGAITACCNDSHVFGAGRVCCCSYETPEPSPAEDYHSEHRGLSDQPIEFCSKECFEELLANMTRCLEIAKDIYPEMWGGKPRNKLIRGSEGREQ